MSRVYLHTPCDGCGIISYQEFYTPTPRSMPRQLTVRRVDDKLLCELCAARKMDMTDDGLRQLDMFDSPPLHEDGA
jgi:hypothetical protein